MADEEEGDKARFRLYLPVDAVNDNTLHLDFQFLNIKIHLCWPDDEREELLRLIPHAQSLVKKGHLEYEVRLEALSIDADLDKLFPESDEEVETGE